MNPFLISSGRPQIIAHGGAKQLYPENTVLAFEHVVELGVDAIEADIVITKDGVLVTHHNLTVDRWSNGTGDVASFTYEELTALDFSVEFSDPNGKNPYLGDPKAVPETVENLLTKFPSHLFVLELKNRGELGLRAADEMVRLIRIHQMTDRVLVASFDDAVITRVREAGDGSILTSTAQAEATRFVLLGKLGLGFLFRSEAEVFSVPVFRKAGGILFKLDRKHLIKLAHRKGMAVQYWTINDPAQMQRLIDLGADGLITDRPDLLREIVEKDHLDA